MDTSGGVFGFAKRPAHPYFLWVESWVGKEADYAEVIYLVVPVTDHCTDVHRSAGLCEVPCRYAYIPQRWVSNTRFLGWPAQWFRSRREWSQIAEMHDTWTIDSGDPSEGGLLTRGRQRIIPGSLRAGCFPPFVIFRAELASTIRIRNFPMSCR